ncbi:MAG: translocation/assembly module TamB domain-containing protein, partial [Vicinamibacterales bacterium]
KLALMNRGLTGTVDANATVNGTSEAPVVSGTVAVTNGGFQTYSYDALKAKIDFNGKTIGLDATLQQSPTQSLTAQGTIPMTLFQRSEGGHVAARTGNELDLHITSTPLSLGIIQGFTSAIADVTGQVIVDVRLTGAGEDPHVEGIIDIQGGGFAVPLTGVSYTGLSTSIALAPERITIPNLQIVDEEGERLTISGSLGVHSRQVGAVDVTVRSRNFELIDNELGDVGVETDIKLTGELRRPQIVGSVKLQAARLEVDKILALFYDPYAVTAIPDEAAPSTAPVSSTGAEEATRQSLSRASAGSMPSAAGTPAAPAAGAPADAPAASSSAFAPVRMNVQLTVPENLVLRGKSIRPNGPSGTAVGDLNITVGGNIDITKEPDAPVILLGQVDTVRGTYQFQGRRFDLVRGGTVRFTGEEAINPLLDVTATRLIPNTGVEARVHITGSVKAPELELTSNPPLDESDILALIVFNRPVNELGSGERTSLAATAGGIAGGFIASPLGDSIGRALDLDLFEISTTTDTGDVGAGVTVGQQIGDRAFLKLRQQFGERTTSEFSLEYSLTSFLRLQANGAPETTGSANRIGQRRIEKAGIDLIFFFSY